jgi:hypothetical protein
MDLYKGLIHLIAEKENGKPRGPGWPPRPGFVPSVVFVKFMKNRTPESFPFERFARLTELREKRGAFFLPMTNERRKKQETLHT